jgi:hypothetical protein
MGKSSKVLLAWRNIFGLFSESLNLVRESHSIAIMIIIFLISPLPLMNDLLDRKKELKLWMLMNFFVSLTVFEIMLVRYEWRFSVG